MGKSPERADWWLELPSWLSGFLFAQRIKDKHYMTQKAPHDLSGLRIAP